MRKVLALFLLICMVVGSSVGFAAPEPPRQQKPEPFELDERVSEFYIGEFFPGDVKYLSNGNVAIQTLDYFMDEPYTMKVREVNRSGEDIEGKSIDLYWEEVFDMPMLISFLLEDYEGNIYTDTAEGVVKISQDYKSTEGVVNLGPGWFDVDQQDRVMFNLMRSPEQGDNELDLIHRGYVETDFYEEGQEAGSFLNLQGFGREYLAEMLSLRDINILGVDFGDRADQLYVLIADNDHEAYKIVELSMDLSDGPGRARRESRFAVEDVIELDPSLSESIVLAMDYDGECFQVSAFVNPEESAIFRINMNGEIEDLVRVPGIVLYFDTKGNETIVSVNGIFHLDESGYFKIQWGTQSTGSPNRLIRERSMGGKTTATFRDGGYGLLRSEDPETGMIDYLAPLRTEEKEVRLRMPLCDVMAKVGGAAQNLEILYGEDRIQIPMTALAVQDLLAQMPCETDATIEIQLVRGQDGTVTVTAELLVVEQVDSMTKVVHRMPIPLP